VLILDEPVATDRLLLRPFRAADLEALHDIRTRPDVLRYLYWPAATLDQTRDIISQRLTMNKLVDENDCLVLAVERRDTGRLVGEADLCWSSVEHRQAELGVILHPEAQGQGYAGEASAALLDLAFVRMGLHRVSARTDARNEPSARVLRRLGMRLEGHLHQCVFFAGRWHDELIFSILAEEWGPDGTRASE